MRNSSGPSGGKSESDKSLLSMLVDTLVSRPELLSRMRDVEVLGKADADVRQALEAIMKHFDEVDWPRLSESEQIERMEQIERGLHPASEHLARRALHWGLENRKHRRPRARRAELPSSLADLEFDGLV